MTRMTVHILKDRQADPLHDNHVGFGNAPCRTPAFQVEPGISQHGISAPPGTRSSSLYNVTVANVADKKQ